MPNDPNFCFAISLIACGISIVALAYVLRNNLMQWLEYIAVVLISVMFVFAIIMTVLYFRGDYMLLWRMLK